MKLVRYGPPGEEQPGIWLEGDENRIAEVRKLAFDIEDYDAHFFTQGGIERLRGLLSDPGLKTLSASDVRLGPPVPTPGKIICIGKNYADHAAEFGSDVPDEPVLFSKATSAINGPFDPIVIQDRQKVDCEAELAVVMGKSTYRVDEADAMDAIAGYTVMNDVTDRVAQKKHGQWFRGKGCDTFCPLGPFLVTPDEIENADSLKIGSQINGETLQESDTSHMVFKIPKIISFISTTITLFPGDVISLGTPAGIGSARNPPVLLKEGDEVSVYVEKVGLQVNPVVIARV